MTREAKIIRVSVAGILANVLLAAFKAAVGLMTRSIAITMDAVNNLSDALSSVITIIGTRLAGKAPDKAHPLGHGRVEYLSAMLIAVIILYAGVTSLVESVKKIITPETPDYSAPALIIVAAAVAVKLLLGRYVRRAGAQLHSDALTASGEDAALDAVISASTLAAAALYLIGHIQLEAWLAAVISLVIIKSGYETLRGTISKLLGERIDSEASRRVKETVAAFPGVFGAYDLILHNYGPDTLIGSVHIEVSDQMDIPELDRLEREITQKVYEETGVILTGISIYSRNTRDDEAARMLEDIRHIVMGHEHVLQMHGFYLNRETKSVRFDMVIDFAAPDREQLYREILAQIQQRYPDHTIGISLDSDISD